MNNLIASAKSGLLYWKLAIIRVIIYGIIVGWGTFEAGVEGYDDLSYLTTLQRIKLIGGVTVAFLGVLLAFLDQTINKLNSNENNNQNTVHTGDTVTINKPPS